MKKYLLPLILILFFSVITIVHCFEYSSQYPPSYSDTYVKSTTKRDIYYWAYYATNPSKDLTWSWSFDAWLSASSFVTNQRFHIDLGSGKIIKRIYYENSHYYGGETDTGVQNFTFWGSNIGAGTFDDLVYGNDEGWTELTVSQNTFDEHTGSDVADPKYITVTNSTAYRYYAFKFADNYGDVTYMGVRRIELQVETEIEILRPNEAGDETALSIGGSSPAGTNWESVDEVEADEWVTDVNNSGTIYKRDLYNLPAHSVGSGTINSIRIYFRIATADFDYECFAKPTQKSGVTVTDGDEVTTWDEDFRTFLQTYTINPATTNPYTWEEIDDLQIGVLLHTDYEFAAACTQVYVEIDYTPIPEVNVIFFSTPY